MEPTLDMCIVDFMEYLTKSKKIYIDLKQFQSQLKQIKKNNVKTVEDLLAYDRDALQIKLRFNNEMIQEINDVSIKLLGQDLVDLSTQRTKLDIDDDEQLRTQQSQRRESRVISTIKYKQKPSRKEQVNTVQSGELRKSRKCKLLIAFLIVLILVIPVVILTQTGLLKGVIIPLSMHEKVEEMLKSTPKMPPGQTFGQDWLLNVNKWAELEYVPSSQIIYNLHHSEYLIKWDYAYTDPSANYTIIENLKIKMGVHDFLYDGSYSGEILHNLPHGIGRFINVKDEIWEGQFFEGKFHGFMRMIGPLGHHTIGKIEMSNWKVYQTFNYEFKEILKP